MKLRANIKISGNLKELKSYSIHTTHKYSPPPPPRYGLDLYSQITAALINFFKIILFCLTLCSLYLVNSLK